MVKQPHSDFLLQQIIDIDQKTKLMFYKYFETIGFLVSENIQIFKSRKLFIPS